MSHETIPAAPAGPPPHRWRIRFPLVLGVVAGVALLLPLVWEWAELDPAPLMRMKFLGQFVSLVCAVLIVAWYFLFSGFSARSRLGTLAAIGLIVGIGFAFIRKIEWTGSWRPIGIPRWEQDPQELLAKHLEKPGPADLPLIDLTVDALRDFPRYRGAQGDGVVRGLRLTTDWEQRPPRLLWRQPVGGGYAGFAVAGNVAVTIEQRRDKEAVVCYDRATGQQRWVYDYPARFTRSELMGGDGPRATPAIDDGDVYSLGAAGHLACLDGHTGKARWTANILEDNQAKNAEWGMSGSPLVVGKTVIVNPGINPSSAPPLNGVVVGQSLAAYDRQTGKRVWAAGNRPAAYSSPQLVTLAGRQQVLLFDGVGLASFDPENGRELWSYPWETMMGMNNIQPVLLGDDRVLVSSEVSNGAAVVRIRAEGDVFAVEEVWHNKKFAAKFANPVHAQNQIFGLGYGYLTCLDAATGELRWKQRRGPYGHGQILLAGEHLLVLSEDGELALAAADPTAFRELARLPVFRGKTWNTPAIAGRQLFIRNHKEMACFELPVVDEKAP